jgi:hypothetical protein
MIPLNQRNLWKYYLRLLTPHDFPLQWSQRVSMSQHFKIACTFVLGLDDEHPLCVIQLEVELHLLVEDMISSISAEAYEKLSHVTSFLPLLFSFGRRVVV